MTTLRAKSGPLSRYLRLTQAERRVLRQALVLLPLNGTALRVIGYRRWQGLLTWRLPALATPGITAHIPAPLPPQRLAELVFAASREGLATGACLERALTLWWLLRRRRFAAELRIGARRENGRFEAHAWVELDGMALNEAPLQGYAPFESLAELSHVKFV